MVRRYDLTQPFAPGMPKLPFMPAPRFEVLMELQGYKPKISQLHICTHLGTHVDAPCHYIQGGKAIGEYPVERFLLPAVVWSVSVGPMQAITLEHLRGLQLQRGDALLLATGWGERSREPRYLEHPFVDEAVAEWLVAAGASLLGVDFLTPEKPPQLRDESFTAPIHHTLLANEVLIIENLTGLMALAGKRVQLFAPPILVHAAVEAAPARVFAEAAD